MSSATTMQYTIIIFSLIITILGGIVMGSATESKIPNETTRNNIKRSGTGVFVMGLITLLLTIGLVLGAGEHLKSSLYYF
jgi:hypothetical protein